MRILSLIILFLMTNITLSATVIRGVIHKGAISTPLARDIIEDNIVFPRKHYHIQDLIIRREKNAVAFKKNIEIAENTYNFIDNIASLDLISYDEKSGYFKFALSIKAKKIYHLSSAPNNYDPISLDSTEVLLDTDKSKIFIEGRVIIQENKKVLIPLPKSEFSITLNNALRNRLSLTALRDIPISIYPE